MTIEVRLLMNEELTHANDFFNKIYKLHRAYEHFKWEFLDCPAGSAIYVAAIDTSIKTKMKIVGIQCAIPLLMITSEGQQILTAKSEDTLVDPEYRGQDIFNKMYNLLFEECKKAGIKYIWGFTPAYKPFIKLGFKLNFKSAQLLYVNKPIAAYHYLSSLNPKNKLIDKVKILGLSFLSKLNSFKSMPFSKLFDEINYKLENFELEIVSKTLFKENTNQLFLYEDREYFNWRIFKNIHNNNYKNLVFRTPDNKCVADVIINTRGTVGYIEQIIFTEILSEKSKKAIIKQCLNVLTNLGVPIIRFLGFEANSINQSEVKLLIDIGFYKVTRGNWFVWKSLDNNFNHEPENIVLNRLFTQGIM